MTARQQQDRPPRWALVISALIVASVVAGSGLRDEWSPVVALMMGLWAAVCFVAVRRLLPHGLWHRR